MFLPHMRACGRLKTIPNCAQLSSTSWRPNASGVNDHLDVVRRNQHATVALSCRPGRDREQDVVQSLYARRACARA